jgi:transposase
VVTTTHEHVVQLRLARLAELLPHGLLRASVIPPVAQRELRDLTRYRSTFIRERVTLINRVQKLLEDANICPL